MLAAVVQRVLPGGVEERARLAVPRERVVLVGVPQHLSANFARRGRTATWDGGRHRPRRTGSPRLAGVLAALECTVEERLPGGDHEIIIGHVRDVETGAKDAAPLLYWRGGYGMERQ